MKKTKYIFSSGRLERKDNTLKFTPVDPEGTKGGASYLPVVELETLYFFGSIDANSNLYTFLGQNQIDVHFFDYYENYQGSFMPKEQLLSGELVIRQSQAYTDKKHRLRLARAFVYGAVGNIQKNLRYYERREKPLTDFISTIEKLEEQLEAAADISALMGLEGNIRQTYYQAFDHILEGFEMGNRSRQPPSNEVNALISFGNSLCYTLCMNAIYHTQLNPTISFLHQPGRRRYSLALDLAEVFKPILVDKVIFTVLNRKIVQKEHFERKMEGCFLKENGRKKFIEVWQEKLKETFKHPELKKSISYKHLIKVECYKLINDLLGIETYKPFKMRW
ncbi:MAG: type I-B CRISPR-associated endonuclease Cas1b [Microscillaceae bacterium]|nr:type I-B CRISPR-associated endonuclease Cas1b [Microscillaceae bacterium]